MCKEPVADVDTLSSVENQGRICIHLIIKVLLRIHKFINKYKILKEILENKTFNNKVNDIRD